MSRIYFKLRDGNVVDDYYIARCHYLVNNEDIYFDTDRVREYAKTLAAIECELETSEAAIRDLVQNDRLITAVKMYRDIHPEASLLEAKSIIDKIRKETHNGY